MTIDRIINALEGAAEDAKQCMFELDAKVQDLESENTGLRSSLDDAKTDNESMCESVRDLEDRLSEALASAKKVG